MWMLCRFGVNVGNIETMFPAVKHPVKHWIFVPLAPCTASATNLIGRSLMRHITLWFLAVGFDDSGQLESYLES